jgi:uridine kinase
LENVCFLFCCIVDIQNHQDDDFCVAAAHTLLSMAFADSVLPSKKYADVIIPLGGDNHVAIDLIVQHIHTKLGQHGLC